MKFAQLHVGSKNTGVRVSMTETAGERMCGLLHHAHLPASEALLLDRCGSVHTFGMRFAIDVLFLNRHQQIVAIHYAVPKWRMLFSFRATQTLEMSANAARGHGLNVGDTLSFETVA